MPNSFAGYSVRPAAHRKECWRFVIKCGIKAEVDHRRWHQEELDEAHELLTKYSVEEVAKQLNRSRRLFGALSRDGS